MLRVALRQPEGLSRVQGQLQAWALLALSAGWSLEAEWLLGSSGDSGADGADCAVSIPRWPELTGALRARAWCCPATAAPAGTAGRRRAPSPAPPWPGCRPRAAVLRPSLLVLLLLVLVFIPSPVLGCELPEDRRCDLVKAFFSLSFFNFCSAHLEAGGSRCSVSEALSLR